MARIKLTYFDTPGRGELIRLLLVCGGIEFVDERVSFADFPGLKPALPLGQVPILDVDGTTYVQSMAIARYAAKLSGLYPTDPVAALRVDMISETLSELRTIFIPILYQESDETVRAEKTKKFVEETVPKALGVLEGMVQGRFFDGDSTISLADVHLFDLVTNALKVRFPQITTTAFPKLEAVIANVSANANIAAYLADAKPNANVAAFLAKQQK